MDTPNSDTVDLESKFPSIGLAYAIALNSAAAVAQRVDGMNGRLQNAMTACTALVSFVCALAIQGTKAVLLSPVFWSAVTLATAAVVLACVGLLHGRVRMIAAEPLCEGWLHLAPAQFQLDLIHFLAKHEEHNAKLTDRKWRITVAVLAAFVAALVLVLVAVATAPR
ncbi:MAG TPA: hypothetical protein PJ986_04110 [Gammaproteobacteria bacterium]|nr:hypothetical protein [Gammaproteobacteria bacterium]